MACESTNLTVSNCAAIEIGDSYSLNFKYDSVTDLTGQIIQFDIRDPDDKSVSLLLLEEVVDPAATGIYFIDRAIGDLNIVIHKADTSTLEVKTYVYEMKNVTTGKTLMRGGVQAVKGEF